MHLEQTTLGDLYRQKLCVYYLQSLSHEQLGFEKYYPFYENSCFKDLSYKSVESFPTEELAT